MNILSTLQQRWLTQTSDALVSEGERLREWDSLVAAYTQPHRAYHNLQHIHALFQDLATFSEASHSPALLWAIWYHDIVYDARAVDNEEKSADLAVSTLSRWGFSHTLCNDVRRLILLTKSHKAEPEDTDGSLLLDLDLGILGRERASYHTYASQVRMEFRWAPRDLYASGRTRVLDSFLERERIFKTAEFSSKWELQARENLRWERDQWNQPGFDF